MAMRMTAAVALVTVMCVLAPRATTQAPNTPSCAASLVPCAPYINTTGTPPDACCGPLKDAVQNDLKYLCDLYATPPPLPPHPPRREDELVVDGWPTWLLDHVPREALQGIVLKSADAYDMIEKVGEGSYSTVYKARERGTTGRIVALKKVRFNTSDAESARFMAKEIEFMQQLDHPNVMKLEGIATSRTNGSIYLVFEFMYSDLGWLVFRSGQRSPSQPQIKRYMQQLLAGLQHCHERGILHLDIKGCNLLIDRHGVLKIGDFGLASYYGAGRRLPPPNRVVSLWYRAPELLLGSTSYGVGVDLWSAGCILAEMFLGKNLMPGSGVKDQLLQIFRLFGSPPDDYWRKMELSPSLKPLEPYNSTMAERFRDLPPSSLGLLATLLALDPAARGTAGQALQSSFFSTPPLPLAEPWPLPLPLVEAKKPRLWDITISLKGLGANPRHIPLKLFQDQEDDELTDTENSGQEEPVTDTGNPAQGSAAANASSSAHDAPSEETIVKASPSIVARRFSGSPVVQKARPVQMVVAQDQKQLPTPNTSHHHSGSDDDDHEDHKPITAPDQDEEEVEAGEPPSSGSGGGTVNRGPESTSSAFVSDFEAAAAARLFFSGWALAVEHPLNCGD